MKKLKILQVIRQGKIGGGETHVLELCTHLDKEKFEPVVLSFTPGPMVDELNRRGIRTKVIHTEKPFDFRVWKSVLKFIRSEKFDLIHAHGTRAMSNVFRPAKKAELPLIYTVHGWSFHIDQNPGIRKIREFSEKFLTGKADRTICVSESNQNDGILRFNMKRSTVIYNAVNIGKFDPEKQFRDIRKELGIPAEKTVIGYIVRMTVQKDPFTMLKAMKEITEQADNVVLLMVGDGKLKQQAVALAQNLNISEHVIFQPFRTDIPDVLNAVDIYCLPSLWEGFPIGILEAMAMKKAVVASPVDGTRELVKDGRTGLLIPQQRPHELADTLLFLHHNPKIREMLASKASDFVRSNFSITDLATKVQKEYATLLNPQIQR